MRSHWTALGTSVPAWSPLPAPRAGWAGPLSPPLRIPSVSVSFRLQTHTDVETWKIFMQLKCCFLSRAVSSSLDGGGRTLPGHVTPQLTSAKLDGQTGRGLVSCWKQHSH